MDVLTKLQDHVKSMLKNTSITSYNGLLNSAIADEFLASMQYSVGAIYTKNEKISSEFRKHANEELSHIKILGELINEFSENITVCPSNLMNISTCGYEKPYRNDMELLNDNIKSEGCAIVFYLGLKEIMPEQYKERIDVIIKQEEEHLKDLKELLKEITPV